MKVDMLEAQQKYRVFLLWMSLIINKVHKHQPNTLINSEIWFIDKLNK